MTPAELDAIEKRADALRCEECSGHGEHDLDGPGYEPGSTAWCGDCNGYGTVDSLPLTVAVMADVAALVAEVRRYGAAVEKLRALAGDAATQDFECSCDGYDNDGCRHQGAALALEKACRLFGEVTP